MENDFFLPIQAFMQAYPLMLPIIGAIKNAGGTAYFVGGCVRDIFMQRSFEDVDIEVHGLQLSTLEKLLQSYGTVIMVGKSFGVLRCIDVPVDWSVPRRDSSGRKPQVVIDYTMDFAAAAQRRDVTINAIGINAHTREIEDPFNGIADIQSRRLRAVDVQKFIEDPLRLFRVMQFIARFDMVPDAALNDVCQRMHVADVSRERIKQEYKKLFLKGIVPGKGILWLCAIRGCDQSIPETVLLHDIQNQQKKNLFFLHAVVDPLRYCTDLLNVLAQVTYESHDEKLLCMYIALAHVLYENDIQSDIHTLLCGEAYSVENSNPDVLFAYFADQKIRASQARVLAQYIPYFFQKNSQGDVEVMVKAIAYKIQSAGSVRLLLTLIGVVIKVIKNYIDTIHVQEYETIIVAYQEAANKAGVLDYPENPLLTGADILPLVHDERMIGKVLQEAYYLQITKKIKDRALLKKEIEPYIQRV